MAVTFPYAGENKRWRVRRGGRQTTYGWRSYGFNTDHRYAVVLEVMRPARTEVKYGTEIVRGRFWFSSEKVQTVSERVTVPEEWIEVAGEGVDDLDTETLLDAADRILERRTLRDYEESRFGVYPPKTLEP